MAVPEHQTSGTRGPPPCGVSESSTAGKSKSATQRATKSRTHRIPERKAGGVPESPARGTSKPSTARKAGPPTRRVPKSPARGTSRPFPLLPSQLSLPRSPKARVPQSSTLGVPKPAPRGASEPCAQGNSQAAPWASGGGSEELETEEIPVSSARGAVSPPPGGRGRQGAAADQRLTQAGYLNAGGVTAPHHGRGGGREGMGEGGLRKGWIWC